MIFAQLFLLNKGFRNVILIVVDPYTAAPGYATNVQSILLDWCTALKIDQPLVKKCMTIMTPDKVRRFPCKISGGWCTKTISHMKNTEEVEMFFNYVSNKSHNNATWLINPDPEAIGDEILAYFITGSKPKNLKTNQKAVVIAKPI